MKTKTKTLSEQLRDAVRKATDQGISQRELCDRAGIDVGMLSRFMTGTRSMTLESADKVWLALAQE